MTILSALTFGLFGNTRPTETTISDNSDRGLKNPRFFEDVSDQLISLVQESNKRGYNVTLKLNAPITRFDNDLDYLLVSGEFIIKCNTADETKVLSVSIKERDWLHFRGDKTYGPTISFFSSNKFGFNGDFCDVGGYTFLIQSPQDPKTWLISRTEGSVFNRKYVVTALPDALDRMIKTLAATPDPAHLTNFRGLRVTPIIDPAKPTKP